MWACINRFMKWFKWIPEESHFCPWINIQVQYSPWADAWGHFQTFSPWDITSWESLYGSVTAGEANHTLEQRLLAYTLNWINEEAPRCVTAMRRQQWIETDIHQGLLVDLISLCLPPCAVPENLKHHKHYLCAVNTQGANRKLTLAPTDVKREIVNTSSLSSNSVGRKCKSESSFWKRGMWYISVLFVSGRARGKANEWENGWHEVCSEGLSSGMLCWDQVSPCAEEV